MFATLKNKIREETGNDVPSLPVRSSKNRYQRNSFESTSSVSIESLSIIEQKDAEINALKIQCKEIGAKCSDLAQKLQNLQSDKERLENSNIILEETVSVAQVQKELIYDEQDKIQNFQLQEISKLKSLLHFREQEALDRLTIIKQLQQQVEQLKAENKHLREQESLREDIQDELQKLRHSSQIEKNNLTTSLAAIEEQNRHLQSKLNIFEDSRLNFTLNLSKDEKVQALIQERKLLEQRLEEAHLHLSDIKSSWSGQNLALETQVSRLSHQVAAETTEKRKAIASQSECVEKMKVLQFNLEKLQNEITSRDNKIKLLEEEIDDLSSTLKEIRMENEEVTTFLRSKVKQCEQETEDLRSRLEAADERLNDNIETSDTLTKSLMQQIGDFKSQINQIGDNLESEKQEKLTVLLENAEISQELAILRQDLKNEKIEIAELNDNLQKLQITLDSRENEIKLIQSRNQNLSDLMSNQSLKIAAMDDLNKEIGDKNKTIKVLKQRLVDFKKTLQHELRSSNTNCLDNHRSDICEKDIKSDTNNSNHCKDRPIVMDEVNFKYLKHVILKFLTCRDVEARHLIRAVGTLLQLSQEEEKLLRDTFSFKMSWFGTRPEPVLR